MLTADERKALRKKLVEYEGCVEHMYLDVVGKVTVGIGHLLASVADARQLPFRESTGAPATADDVKKEYENIKRQPHGYSHPASFYKKYTKLRLDLADIDALADKHLNAFETELKRLYPGFELYPKDVRLALFDMIFNLGMSKLRTRYQNFNKAILAGDWAQAARESSRAQIQSSRNHYVMDLLDRAARATQPVSSGAQ